MSHVDPNSNEAAAPVNVAALANISNEGHLRVMVNDLVAFEYVHPETRAWRWGLGTVAGLPGPRLAQLLLWSGGPNQDAPLPPAESPLSPEERAAAQQRLAELQKLREELEFEAGEANKELAARNANYMAQRHEYQLEVDTAAKTLREAKEMVQKVSEEDWREIRSYSKPPEVVKMILEAMMLALGERTQGWNEIRVVLRSRDFVSRLTSFDPEKVSDATSRKIKKEYLSKPRFTYEDAMNASRALGAIQRWVVANTRTVAAKGGIVKYDKKHHDEKAGIEEMERRIAEFNRALRQYDQERDELAGKLGTPALKMDHRQAGGGAGGGGDAAGEGADPYEGTPIRDNTAETVASPRGAAWELTERAEVVLRAAILVNYDRPEARTVTLTDAQIAQLERALRERASPTEQEQQAALARKRLEDQLRDARGDLAAASEELKQLKEREGEHEGELREKDRLLEDLTAEAAEAEDAAERRMALEEELDAKEAELQELRRALEDAKNAERSAADGRDAAEKTSGQLQALVQRLDEEVRAMRAKTKAMADAGKTVSIIIENDLKVKALMEQED